jgi:hypothetical protein
MEKRRPKHTQPLDLQSASVSSSPVQFRSYQLAPSNMNDYIRVNIPDKHQLHQLTPYFNW